MSKRQHKESSLPKIGEIYACFDDGKITPSRLYFVRVTEVKKLKECDDDIRRLVVNQQRECDWLFERRVNPFVVSAVSFEYEEPSVCYFLWSYEGFWFSLGGFLNSGELDIDGSLVERLKDIGWDISKNEILEIINERRQ